MIITSKQNVEIKHLVSLKDPKRIKRSGTCFVESKKVVFDLMKLGRIERVYLTEENADLLKTQTCKTTVISREIAHYLSETKTTDGVFGICKIIEPKSVGSDKVILLDNLQDPSNVGAIIRSAVAFGYKDIIMINGAYPYAPKVIRSSMGHVFNVNIFFFTYAKLVDFIKQNKYNLIKADLGCETINKFNPSLPLMLAIGNEGNGISEEVDSICNGSVSIPMDSRVESLNASVSAGILMYEINNKLEK